MNSSPVRTPSWDCVPSCFPHFPYSWQYPDDLREVLSWPVKWAVEAGALLGHLSRSDFLPGDAKDCAAILPNGHMRKGSLNPPLSVSGCSRRPCAHPSQEFAYSKVYPYWWTWSKNTLRLTSPARRTTGRIPARWKMVKSDLIELR